MPQTRIPTLAARALLDEITSLRDDIHEQGQLLKRCEILLIEVYADLRGSNRACLPRSS